jgi:hypothetical protein
VEPVDGVDSRNNDWPGGAVDGADVAEAKSMPSPEKRKGP